MTQARFIPLSGFVHREPGELLERARAMRQELQRRRTLRQFSDRAVPREVIEEAILAAGSAPSGANRQPWHFVAVGEPELKQRLRVAAEAEEAEFYRNGPAEWLEALEHLGTDEHKEYLEVAPWLIVVFSERYEITATGKRTPNYYVQESVGIACGMLIATLHHAGLATLTHTPSPMGFLNEVLDRTSRERAVMVIVTGYPADDAEVPVISKKSLAEIATFR